MTAYIGGTFDIIHPGHLKLFRFAKQRYGRLIIGLNSDEFVLRYKHKLPAMGYYQRLAVLQALRMVDDVILNIGDEYSGPSILSSGAHTIVCGSDWTRERIMTQMNLSQQFLDDNMISLIIYKDSDPIHSSDIKKRI